MSMLKRWVYIGIAALTGALSGAAARGADVAPPPMVAGQTVMIWSTGPVLDQGDRGTCGPNAVASQIMHRGYPMPSRLYIYWETRTRQMETPGVKVDWGVKAEPMYRALVDAGWPDEKLWDYRIDFFRKRPSWEAYKQAATRLNKPFHPTQNVLADLAAGTPVVVGIPVYASFDEQSEQIRKTGVWPKPRDKDDMLIGGHAIILVGFSVTERVYYIKNSWGTEWGKQGYGTLPMDYPIKWSWVLDKE